MITLSGPSPSRSDAASMIRRFAWCDTNRSICDGSMPLRLEQPPRDLLGVLHRELEDRRPFLLHVVQPLVDRLVRRRQLAAAGRHAQRRAAAAVDHVREVDDVRLAFLGDRHDDRAGAVAEQHARRPVGVVDDARHHVGADRQRVIARAGGDHLHRRRQRVGEAGAGGAEIEAPRVAARRSSSAACRRCSERSCPASSCRRR